jgi:uncharacterized membrane protein YbhN (UPF0104 family)
VSEQRTGVEAPDAAGLARSRRIRIAGLVISALSIGAVVIWALGQPAPRLPDDASGWLAFTAALCTYAVATAVRSERWLSLLRHDGIRARRADAWGLTVVGFMGNNVLPARGGDALSAYLMANRNQILFRYPVASIIAMRVLDLATIIVLYLVVAHGLLSGIEVPGGSLVGFETAIAAVIALAALGCWIAVRRGHFSRLGELAATLLGTTRRLRGRHGALMVAVTFAIWGAEAATLMLCGEAVGFRFDLLEALYLIGLVGVFLLIPSGPGYAGTFDAAMLFGAGALGASPELAISFLLIARFVDFIPITIAGLVLMLTTYGWDSFGLRPGAAAQPSAGLAELGNQAGGAAGEPQLDRVDDREQAEQQEAL